MRSAAARSFVVSANLKRRHLDTSQRAMVAARLANLSHGGNRKSDQGANLPLEQAADLTNVSPRAVQDARTVLASGDAKTIAARLANLPHGGDRKSDQKRKTTLETVKIEDAANLTNVSQDSVKQARTVLASGDAKTITAVDRGEVAVSKAAKQIRAGA